MDVEFTFDGYTVTVYVPNVDFDNYDEDEIIDLAKDVMSEKGIRQYVMWADCERVL